MVFRSPRAMETYCRDETHPIALSGVSDFVTIAASEIGEMAKWRITDLGKTAFSGASRLLPVCLSFYLSACLPGCLPGCLSACLPVRGLQVCHSASVPRQVATPLANCAMTGCLSFGRCSYPTLLVFGLDGLLLYHRLV